MRSVLVWLMVLLGIGRRELERGHDRLHGVNSSRLKPVRFRSGVSSPLVKRRASQRDPSYSHSMVPGGLLVMSSTTRLTSATSLVMRVEMRSSTS